MRASRAVRSLLLLPLLPAVVVACAAVPPGEGAGVGAAPTGEPMSATPGSEGGDAGELLYVANQDEATVSIFDVETRELVGTVDLQALGFGPTAKPHHIAVEPDGSFWYLSLIGANRVLKLDADGGVAASAEFEVPGMLALHPTNGMLYVGRSMSAVNPPPRIGVIRRADMTLEELDVAFPRPHALAIAPDGGHVYSASLGVNQLAAIGASDERVDLVEVGAMGMAGMPLSLVQFALSPDGRWMVASAEMTGQLLVFDLSRPAAPRLVREVAVGQRPWHPVFTPDSRTVFVGNKGSNSVSVVDAAQWEVLATVEHPSFDHPHGSAVSTDGRWVFVSSNGSEGSQGAVTVIEVATRSVVDVVQVGRNAAGLGVRRAP